MRALVTGGGGFLGRYIVERLVAKGDFVRVLGRHHYPELDKLGVETIQADIRDREETTKACRNIDIVFHVASRVGHWGKWEEFYDINFVGTKNVVEGCKAHNVHRLVYTSSPSVVFHESDLCGVDETYPYPARYKSHYAETKAMAEKYVIASNGKEGLLTTVLRPHLVWGPRDNHLIPALVHRARKGELIMVGDGKNKVDFTYVENVADAHLLAGDRLTDGSSVAGQIYFISQGEPVIIWDFVNDLLTKLKIPPVQKRISFRTARLVGSILEAVYRLFPFRGEPRITRFLAAQMAYSHYFNISKAKRDLGYEPRISTSEGLERLIKYLRESDVN